MPKKNTVLPICKITERIKIKNNNGRGGEYELNINAPHQAAAALAISIKMFPRWITHFSNSRSRRKLFLIKVAPVAGPHLGWSFCSLLLTSGGLQHPDGAAGNRLR